ncbi:MAG: hypothetical protein ACJAZ1_000765 [Yoonia sp.]|jgi:hypothetical protein
MQRSPSPATSQVHSKCADFLLNAPIHLRVLTQHQERALNFIKKTGALEIGHIEMRRCQGARRILMSGLGAVIKTLHPQRKPGFRPW